MCVTMLILAILSISVCSTLVAAQQVEACDASAAGGACFANPSAARIDQDSPSEFVVDDISGEHVSLLQGGLRGRFVEQKKTHIGVGSGSAIDLLQSRRDALKAELQAVEEGLKEISTKEQRDNDCPLGYQEVDYNLDGEGKKWQSAYHLDDCARMCSSRNGCTSFEYSSDESQCGTYTGGNSNIEFDRNQASGWLSCLKHSCPSDYSVVHHNLDGTGKQWTEHVSSVDGCKSICDGRSSCTSFEYNWDELKCGTYTGGSSNIQNDGQLDEWISCLKDPASSRRRWGGNECPFGYSSIYHNLDGTGKQWTEHVMDIDHCSWICDGRHSCTSFEYSSSEDKCGTYTGGNSNIQSDDGQEAGWTSCLKNNDIRDD